MQALLRRRLEMAARVCEFLRTQKTEAEGEEPALTGLEQLIARANALAAEQRAGIVAVRSTTAQRAAIRHEVEGKLLRFLVAAGVVASHNHLELAEQFQLPPNGSHQAFLTAARGLLQTATAQKELLVKEGMKASLLADLSTALDAFEQTLEASRVGRRLHTGASAELQAISVEIVERVRVLDGLVRYSFGDDVQLMGAWASARNVLGPFRSQSQPAAGQGQTPATQGPDAARPAA
ncbi:MAG TPA: hypothetical protein VKQ05_14115 [Gemmatimonadales bacterium]|nr:hypothetical protein [Gemmatimonadales bacterium]